MNIYVAHSRSFDFQTELYEPIRQSSLNNEHSFILPHEKSDQPRSSKEFFKNECALVIAEVSYPATGLGIELGWADALGVPIIFLHKKGSKISNSLKILSSNFIEYSNQEELISGIEQKLKMTYL